MKLDDKYWSERYATHQTQWNVGHVTPPLKAYFDQLTNRNMAILIPGCGHAYEAEYLYKSGFKNVVVADVAHQPLEDFRSRCAAFPPENLLKQDYFKLDKKYDLMVEQTFFCALEPVLRSAYAQQAARLIRSGGRLVGLLFNDTLNRDRPPFGGTLEEYRQYFEPYFHFHTFETAHNSIPPRAGRELFINLVRR